MAARLKRAATLLALAVSLGACAGGAGSAPVVTFPPQTFGPAGTPSPLLLQGRAAIAQALGQASIQIDDPEAPYRPAEAPALAAAPRAVYQAVLPQEPGRGYISIYQLADPAAATAAARAQAEYVASPVGRVQFPTGTQFEIRTLDSLVVFYPWLPGGSEDDQGRAVAEALRSVGTAVPVPG